MSGKIIFFCVLLVGSTLSGGEFFLYKNGKPAAVLVKPRFSPPRDSVEKREQELFLNLIKLFAGEVKHCTGRAFPIAEKAPPGERKILFQLVHKKIDDCDEFSWDFPNERTMRITATPVSIRYALKEIMERGFGAFYLMHYPHWLKRPAGYTKDMETIYPARKNVSLPAKRFSAKASFYCKRHIVGDIYKDWNMKNSYPYGHGMAIQVFPAGKYAADNSWPKSILPIIQGKRYVMPKLKAPDPRLIKNPSYMHVGRYSQYMSNWQPCWSNPESVTIAAKNIMEALEKSPIDPLYKHRKYSVNMDISDNGGCCECKKCLAVVKEKRNCMGAADYSELYWKWVNKVAEIVCRKYPEIKFNCLAYREVTTPPPFKLHKNVIPQIARELAGPAIDPVEKKKSVELFRKWASVAETIFIWDYTYGSKFYAFPRIYFGLQGEMTKMAYQNKVRGIFSQGEDRIGMEGPKFYLIARQMWDVNADISALLKEWCRHAVGPEAAPYLEEYYRFWEQYWLRPELRETKWFDSASSIYMLLGESGSYTYALRKGEMARLRRLMEKVVEKAGSPMEKKRALYFMRVFRISENASKCFYSEYIRPNGTIANAADAVALLRSVPEAFKALQALENEALVTMKETALRFLAPARTAICNFSAIAAFKEDPQVKGELRKIAGNGKLPPDVRGQAKVMLGACFKNLMEDGSFEDSRNPAGHLIRRAKRDKSHVSHGKWAVCGLNPFIQLRQKKGLVYGKTYMVMVDIYAEKQSTEGVASFLANPQTQKNENTIYNLTPNIKFHKGWQTLSGTVKLLGRRGGLPARYFCMQLFCKNFEKDERIWIDNVRLYQLD